MSFSNIIFAGIICSAPASAQDIGLPDYFTDLGINSNTVVSRIGQNDTLTNKFKADLISPETERFLVPADSALATMQEPFRVQVGSSYSIVTDAKENGAIIWQLDTGQTVAFEWCRWLPVCTTNPD